MTDDSSLPLIQQQITHELKLGNSAIHKGFMGAFNFIPHTTDSKIKIHSLYLTNDANQIIVDKPSYQELLNGKLLQRPILFNFNDDGYYNISAGFGLYPAESADQLQFSFYKREYEIFDDGTVFKGEWMPVAVHMSSGYFYDYNVTAGRSYQYICYPIDATNSQTFANTGDTVETKWDCWSIVELKPSTHSSAESDTLGKQYEINEEDIWFFKYNLDVGSQTQNINKSEQQTLGQYAKISNGMMNNISGSVSCLLGSEIIPYTNGYTERLRESKDHSLSTNEKVKMLNAFRKMIFSKNPKLLKDKKGQAWIVQTTGASNTPKNSIHNQPDQISFNWREVESMENVMIFGNKSNSHDNLVACRSVRTK